MDWSWLDTVVGAGIATVAFALGQARGRSRRQSAVKEPEPVCGCGHHYSLHDDNGACHGTSRVLDERGVTGRRWSTQLCTCVRYTGPEPLPRYVP